MTTEERVSYRDRLDRLSQENERLAAELKSVLNAAADRLDKLPVGGEALKGPYWYRQGVHDAANLLRDWADASGAATAERDRDPDEDGDLQERIATLIGSGMVLRVPPQQIAGDIEALVEAELRDRMLPVSDIANAEIRMREDAEVEVSRLTAELNDTQRQNQSQWKRAESAEAQLAETQKKIENLSARFTGVKIHALRLRERITDPDTVTVLDDLFGALTNPPPGDTP